MELDKMQTLWQEMSQQIETQKSLTEKIILDMTQQKYTQKFSKISMYESIGAVICFIAAIFIFINFEKLDTWYLAACGIITLISLLALPIFVLRSLKSIKGITLSNSSFKETIIRFTKAKNQLLLIQKLGLYINVMLFLVSIPVASKLIGNKDMFITEASYWNYGFIAIVGILVTLVSRWGLRCYQNVTNSAENILREIDN